MVTNIDEWKFFYEVDHAPVHGNFFATRKLTRDLFAVGSLLVANKMPASNETVPLQAPDADGQQTLLLLLQRLLPQALTSAGRGGWGSSTCC